MIPGYNHNLRHRGRIFHIQTEDSGPKNPVIITHLFAGGTILATDRWSYADVLHLEDVEVIVRERMKEQHKMMLRRLVNGQMDELLGLSEEEPGSGAEASPAIEARGEPVRAAPAPDGADRPARPRPEPAGPVAPAHARPEPAAPVAQAPRPTAVTAPRVSGIPPMAPLASPDRPTPTPVPLRPLGGLPARPRASPDRPTPTPVPLRPLGGVAAGPHASPPPRPLTPPPRPLAPPPRPLTPPAIFGPRPPVQPPPRPVPAAPSHRAATTPASRDAVIAPVIVVGAEPPQAQPQYPGVPVAQPPLFGEDVISDKNLDDVILQYLAEEFMAEDKK